MPRQLRTLILRCRSLFRSMRVEVELDEEMQFHLDQQIDVFVGQGLSRSEARRAALKAFGGVDQQKEACRDTRRVAWIEHGVLDAVHAVRVLRTNPGFASVALLSLALGIGANTAVFQLIDAIRLRHLPVPHAEQLADVRIAGGNGGWGVSDDSNSQLTFPLWEEIRQQQRAFSGLFAWGTTQFLIGSGPDARVVRGLWMSGEAFPVLGLAPQVGRLIDRTDDRRGCEPVYIALNGSELTQTC